MRMNLSVQFTDGIVCTFRTLNPAELLQISPQRVADSLLLKKYSRMKFRFQESRQGFVICSDFKDISNFLLFSSNYFIVEVFLLYASCVSA